MAIKNKREKLFIFIGIPIVIIIGIVGYVVGSTLHIESVANQFQASSSWKLVSSHTVSPDIFCFDVPCPSLSRTWSTPEPVTQKQLLQVLKKSNWNDITLDEDCGDTRENRVNPFICSIHGYIDKYSLTIYTEEQSSITKTPTVSISLE